MPCYATQVLQQSVCVILLTDSDNLTCCHCLKLTHWQTGNYIFFFFFWVNKYHTFEFFSRVPFVLWFFIRYNNPDHVTMANSFTRMMSGRNKAVMLASIGAGTLASAYVFSDSTAAAERKRLYPPRYMCVSVCVCVFVKCFNNSQVAKHYCFHQRRLRVLSNYLQL